MINNPQNSYEILIFYILFFLGSYGQVRRCIKNDTKEIFAVKCIARKSPLQSENKIKNSVMNEQTILKSLRHENIVLVHGCYEDPNFYYTVMDMYWKPLMSGLNHFVASGQTVTEGLIMSVSTLGHFGSAN